MDTTKATTTKESLHALVDGLPEDMWGEAERYLTGLTTDDPLLRKFLLAPLDDEPETEEERLAVEEARAEIARGETFSLEEVKARLSLPD
jgi:hypothetical protein